MARIDKIRPSPIAGTWYEGNRERLGRQIDEFLSNAKTISITGKIIGLVVPHAGHHYSGATAAYAYKAIKGMHFDLVVIISPLHGYNPAELITSAHEAYSTPLGIVPIQQAALAELTKNLSAAKMNLEKVAYDEEHSLEIQLPFLQRTLSGDFGLLPVMMRAQDEKSVEILAKSLIPILKQNQSLIIASSDLSHFYPVDMANALDKEMLRQVELFSPQGVLRAEQTGSGSACGAAPIAAVLLAAKGVGADGVKLAHYSTSGDVTGDMTSVVGYGSAIIYSSKPAK